MVAAVNQYRQGVPRPLHALVVLLTCLGFLALVPTATATATGSSTPAAETHPSWGGTAARNAKIRKGCRGYDYTYTVNPPPGDWSLETFLVGPRGKAYASGYFVTGEDPLTGAGVFRLCRRATKGGKYTIRALLSVQDGLEYAEGWLPETTFRLRKPR